MTASPESTPDSAPLVPARRTNPWLIVLAVAVVAVPLAWGVSQTVMKSSALFHHGATTHPSTKSPKGNKSAASTTQSATTEPATHGSKPSKHKK